MEAVQESSPDTTDPERAFQIYLALREYEQGFNGSQADIKKLASAWMLVTFSAFAFIVRGELAPEKSLIDSAPLLAAIAAGGNIGLLTLWLIDQQVYQRLINAVFTVGLDMERRHPEWPPIRSLMWVESGSRGMARYHALFYAAPMAFNGAAAIYALVSMTGGGNAIVVGSSIVSFILLFIVLGDWFRVLGVEPRLRARSRMIEDVARRWTEVAERR